MHIVSWWKLIDFTDKQIHKDRALTLLVLESINAFRAVL